mmetsp:Transcript_62768/g.125804  ORF Transcript_62768/g.125804 Transcript_62768/m.125804 type:complete len:280 (-) Transcript_62768:742-1581(-)
MNSLRGTKLSVTELTNHSLPKEFGNGPKPIPRPLQLRETRFIIRSALGHGSLHFFPFVCFAVRIHIVRTAAAAAAVCSSAAAAQGRVAAPSPSTSKRVLSAVGRGRGRRRRRRLRVARVGGGGACACDLARALLEVPNLPLALGDARQRVPQEFGEKGRHHAQRKLLVGRQNLHHLERGEDLVAVDFFQEVPQQIVRVLELVFVAAQPHRRIRRQAPNLNPTNAAAVTTCRAAARVVGRRRVSEGGGSVLVAVVHQLAARHQVPQHLCPQVRVGPRLGV